MGERIFFDESAVRKEFFESVKTAISLNSWRQVAKHFGMSRTHFQYHQYGYLTMPKEQFDSFLQVLPKERQEYFLKKISTKPKNWGAKIGGKKTYSTHPGLFEKGRSLAGKESKNRKPSYICNSGVELSKELCEFLGAFIGDGHSYSHGKHFCVCISGNHLLDYEYLTKRIPFLVQLFCNAKPCFKKRKENLGFSVNFHSRAFYSFIVDRFHFPKGVKTYTVKIPDEIMSSDEKFIFAAIRGIFDTDGCVFLDKREKYLKHYPRITLQIASKNLHTQLKDFLSKHFSLYTYAQLRKREKIRSNPIYAIEIYGHSQIEKWMKLIGFSNSRHLSKIKLLNDGKPPAGIEPATSS